MAHKRVKVNNKGDGRLGSVLITGGAGFIGSHLADTLIARDHKVTVIDNLSTGRFENIEHLIEHPEFRFVKATVTDELVMDNLVRGVDLVFHLAAAVGVQLIVDKPVNTIKTNIMGTDVVLRMASEYGVKVLLASTSEIYGKGNGFPFKEDDDVVLGPTIRSRWSYAASKMIDEFLALAYMKERGVPVVIVRLFNTVGPRQTGRYGMVIPRFIEQAMNERPITVYGDGTQTRCFCHVVDVINAMIGLAENPGSIGHVFNVGSTEEIAINELARRVRVIAGGNARIVHISYSEAYSPGFEDMKRRVPDIDRIHQHIGWQPTMDLDDILESVVKQMTPIEEIDQGINSK